MEDTVWASAMENGTIIKELFEAAHEDFVLRTPWPVLSLTLSYLYFVLIFGPSFMKAKKPMTLKRTILIYNAVQVVFSAWWFYESIIVMSSVGWIKSFYVAGGCTVASPNLQTRIDLLGYWYLISKLVELLDTIFFVLRGKQSQVTFLHVYHHTNMAVSTWFFIKHNQGTQSLIIGACNTFVHIVMYAYYLLAALGPAVRRHLWWKRYITRLQITQFLVILTYLCTLSAFGCKVGTAFVTFSAANTMSFLALFVHFYVQAYKRKNRSAPASEHLPKSNGTVDNHRVFSSDPLCTDNKIIKVE